MGTIKAKDTHYMTFPHKTAGILRSGWEVKIYKNGVLFNTIAYDIQEVYTKQYTLNFNNDGTDYSIWTAVVHDPLQADLYFVETWEVRKPTLETNVKQLRSRQDSEGGFLQSSYNQEVK